MISIVGGSFFVTLALLFGIVNLFGSATQAATWSLWQSTQQTNSGSRDWTSIDSSADGLKLAATVATGYIYTSTNGGTNWTQQTNSGSRDWKSIASSSDGVRLVAATVNGNIYTSADSGVNWTARTNAGSHAWADVDSSADGMKLIAAVTGASGADRRVYTSNDAGATWTLMTYLVADNWKTVAISGDGSAIVAASSTGYFDGRTWLSRDGGQTWEGGFGYRDWTSAAFSYDGSKLVVVSNDDQLFIYRQGESDPWDIENLEDDASAVALSSDGNRIAIAQPGGTIAISSDYGASWSMQVDAGTKDWTDVALSADGKKLAATATSDYVYTGSIIRTAGQPTNLSATPTDGGADLSWTAPASNGDSAITDYKIEYSLDGGANWSEFSHSASTAVAQSVTGLTNGYEYIFRVSAVNVVGEGDISNIVSARPTNGSIVITTPQTLTVTTENDENSGGSAGAGCSLREAIIASNTTQAYGGCGAGGGNGDVIYLPNGTYGFQGGGAPDLYLYNGSILGESKAGTIISNFGFTFSGDTATSIKNLTLTSNGPPAYITIVGSHKTVENIDSSGSIPVNILIGSQAKEITDTTITGYTTDVNTPATPIQCTATCRGTTLKESTLLAQQSIPVNIGDEATVENVTMSATYSIDLRVGEDSLVSGVTMTGLDPQSGGNTLTFAEGTVINDVVQENNPNILMNGTATSVTNVVQTGGSISNNVATDEIDGFIMNGSSNVSLNNPVEGAEVKALVFNTTASSNSVNLKASLIDGLVFNGDSQSDFTLNQVYDDATIKNVSIPVMDELNAYIYGDDLTLENIDITSTVSDRFTVVGARPTITDIYFRNVVLELDDTESAYLDRLTLQGDKISNYDGPALNISDLTGDVVIKDSIIKDQFDGGIEVDANSPGTATLLVENTQIENVGNANGSYGAIYTYYIDKVTLDGVTVTNTIQRNNAAVMIQGGVEHTILNTTIFNANGGVAFANSNATQLPAEVTINNSTIVGNPLEDIISGRGSGLTLSASQDEGLHATISNSIIAGNDSDAQCTFQGFPGDTTMVTGHNSISSDVSCGSGFTGVDDVATLVEPALANNGSIAPSIGYGRNAGQVLTLALVDGSEALASGDATRCATYDARGVERDTALCDIGAYQRNALVVVVPGDDDDEEETPGSGSGNTGGSGNSGNENNSQGGSGGSGQSSDKPSTNKPPVAVADLGDDTTTNNETPSTETPTTVADPEDTTGDVAETSEETSSDNSIVPAVIIVASIIIVIGGVITVIVIRGRAV